MRYAQAYYAMKREIARKRGNFRGVCPVPNECSVRNRAAETLSVARVYRVVRDRPAEQPVLFFGHGLIRTVVCTEKEVSSVRIVKDGPNAVKQTYEKEGETPKWQALPTRT